MREKEIKFLEIGILNGSSLNMWVEYFNRGLIYGCDINDYSHLNNDKIKTFILNQESEDDLKSVKEGFDVIHLLQDLSIGKIRDNSNYFITENEFYKLYEQILSIEIFKVKENSITSVIIKK